MRVALISTGEEVLLGEITDTNAPLAASMLTDHGFIVGRHFTCGDEIGELIGTIWHALHDSEVVVASGGLGPTQDDRTLAALAEVLKVPIETDPVFLDQLKRWFASRSFLFTSNQARQARRPRGSRLLPNPIGTAPGIEAWAGDKPIFWLPGPPSEFKALLCDSVLPRLSELRAQRGDKDRTCLRLMRTFGLGEGRVEDQLGNLEAEIPGLTVGFRAAGPEIQIKLRTKTKNREEADAVLERGERIVRERLGDVVFSSNGQSLPELVLALLGDRKLKLAAAESCTGGLLGKLLTDIPGSSAVFTLSTVTYSNEMKERLLGVPPALLATYGAVSEACAKAMADGVRKLSGADLAVAITGIAGPDGGTPEKPVGTVLLALGDDSGCEIIRRQFHGRTREAVRMLSAFTALDLIRRRVLGLPLRTS